MKQTTYILTLILILIGFSSTMIAQNNDKYRVILNRENQKRLEFYDTIITLDYLSELRYESLKNMQIFEGFDYPRFKMNMKVDTTVLFNDSIKITLITNPFDSIGFIKNFRLDSNLYYNSLYFRDLIVDSEIPMAYPKKEVVDLIVRINNKTIYLTNGQIGHLYNPALDCWTYNGKEICGINGYVADNGKILLTLECGEGVGAYKVIFIFDREGKFEKRIEEPVI
jgi:hypothetical protein